MVLMVWLLRDTLGAGGEEQQLEIVERTFKLLVEHDFAVGRQRIAKGEKKK